MELLHKPNNIPSDIKSKIGALAQELPFIDRENETARLKELLRQSSSGNGTLVFVSGEAGIGKTRFAREIATFARGMGFQCLSAKCARGPGVPSHAPWIELIREFSEEAPASRFLRACGANFDQIVRLVPELSESASNPPSKVAPSSSHRTPEEIHSEETQFLLALTGFFSRLSGNSPLLLILDDLQWCDAASLNLLRFFIGASNFAKSKTLILCLYRELEIDAGENPALARLIFELQNRSESIHLQRFDSGNVAQLIERTFPPRESMNEDLAKFLYSKTGGNPFFVVEVFRCLMEQNAMFKHDAQCGTRKESKMLVPETIRNVIEKRLHYLDEATVNLLRIASVIGEGFGYDMLQRVTNPLPRGDRILESLEKALRTGLILQRHSSQITYYVFSDELVRDVLYDEQSPERKKIYHAIIARSLEAQYSGADESSIKEHAAELAHHYLEGGDPAKARDYFGKAGKRASELYAHSDAFEYYQSALDLLEDDRNQENQGLISLRAELLEKMGDESQFLPEYGRVFDCWNASAQLYESSGDSLKAANVYVKTGIAYHIVMYELDKSQMLLDKAVAIATSDKAATKADLARLNAYCMIYDIWKGEGEKVKKRTAVAVQLAKESGLFDVIAMTSSYGIATNLVNEIDESIESCNRGLKIAFDHGFTFEASFCYFHRACAHAYTRGPSPKSLELFLEGLDFTSRANYFMVNLFHKVELVYAVYLPLGEWVKARAMAEDALKSIEAFPPNSLFNVIASSAMGQVLLVEGDIDKARGYLEHVEKVTKGFGVLQLDVPLYIALARVDIRMGEFEKAEKHLREGYRLSKLRGLSVINGVPHIQLLSLMIEFCLSRQEFNVTARDEDEQFLDSTLVELSDAAKEINEEWPIAYCRRADGLIAERSEQFNKCASLLQESITIWRRLGWKWELGKTLFELAKVQLLSKDFESSEDSLRQSLEIFEQLGAGLDVQSAKLRLEKTIELSRLSRLWNDALPRESPRSLFEIMIRDFYEDVAIKKLSIDNSGWRTLSELSRRSKLPRSALYASGSKGAEVFKEMVKSGLVETRVYAGERGRGGNVLKIRVAYDKDKNIREYVSLVFEEKRQKQAL